MKNYKTAFYRSPIADSNSFEQWQTEGSLDLATVANRRYKQLLEEYQQPHIDPSVREELESYVAKRKASMPDRNY
jgi:trimethylamine--corrinoid protein Co-methyltransferase